MKRSAIILLLSVLQVCACHKDRARRQARRPFQACSRNMPCVKPQICLLRPQVTSGLCVLECRRDADCGPGHSCTGRFQAPQVGAAPSRRYCRRADLDAGGDCGQLTHGCKPGLQCARGRPCVHACKADPDCPADQRCEPVPRQRSFGRPAPTLYHACVQAAVKEGGTCSPDQHPRCGRGLRCHRNRCVRQCVADAGCGPGRICDGHAAEARVDPGAGAEIFRYCRRAAALGERCSRQWSRDVGCQPPLQCYRGRCRQTCTHQQDCPAGGSRRLRCQRRRWQRTVLHLCL